MYATMSCPVIRRSKKLSKGFHLRTPILIHFDRGIVDAPRRQLERKYHHNVRRRPLDRGKFPSYDRGQDEQRLNSTRRVVRSYEALNIY